MIALGRQSSATTVAIILGAHEWPEHPALESSTAFLSSATWFNKYICSPKGMNIPSEAVLNLFDTEKSPDKVDFEIGSFIEKRNQYLRERKLALSDVLLYYCGHGTFAEDDDKYVLSLKSTRKGFAGVSSYRMAHLARTLNTYAAGARRFMILDSCYAAAATSDFIPQDDEIGEIIRQAAPLFPATGTALLCAASANIRAKAPRDSQFTMFSGALAEALEKGSGKYPPYLSIRNLKHVIFDNIQALYRDRAVRPEVQTPEAVDGDIADMPLFPNLGANKPYDVFFLHTSAAKSDVKKVSRTLASNRITVLVDEEELDQSYPQRPLMFHALVCCKMVAFCYGSDNQAPWKAVSIQDPTELVTEGSLRFCHVIFRDFTNVSLLEELPSALSQVRPVDVSRDEGLPELITAITGRIPLLEEKSKSTTRLESELSPSALAIDILSSSLKTEGLTLFLGGDLKRGHYAGADHYEATKELLIDMGVVDRNYHELLPSLESVAMYYSIRRTSGALQEKLFEPAREAEIPEIYREVAALISLLGQCAKKRAQRFAQRPQVIFTTTHDIFLERALLEYGLPFSRIIQDVTSRRYFINRYEEVQIKPPGEICVRIRAKPAERSSIVDHDDQILTASQRDREAVRKLLTEAGFMVVPFPFEDSREPMGISKESRESQSFEIMPLLKNLPEPIIYKFYGTEEIRNSCVIAVAQMLRIQRSQSIVPDEIHEIIGNTSALFLGHHFADIEFLQSVEMLSSRFSNHLAQFAIAERPDPSRNGNMRMDAFVWGALKHLSRWNVTLVENSPLAFVECLSKKVKEVFR